MTLGPHGLDDPCPNGLVRVGGVAIITARDFLEDGLSNEGRQMADGKVRHRRVCTVPWAVKADTNPNPRRSSRAPPK